MPGDRRDCHTVHRAHRPGELRKEGRHRATLHKSPVRRRPVRLMEQLVSRALPHAVHGEGGEGDYTESAAAVSGAGRKDGYSHDNVTYRQRFCQK